MQLRILVITLIALSFSGFQACFAQDTVNNEVDTSIESTPSVENIDQEIALPALETQPAPVEDALLPPLVEDPLDLSRSPTPVAVLETIEEACLAMHAGDLILSEDTFSNSTSDITPMLKSMISTAPLPGEFWTIGTLETPIVVGTIEGKPGSCQILATTPFGDVVTKNIVNRLGSPVMQFLTYQEAELAPGISQIRLKKGDEVFIDVHKYVLPTDALTTLHLILQ